MNTAIVTCPCGVEFPSTPARIAAGRGRYCSQACKYQYRVRPRGLTYQLKVANRGWFAKGHRPLSGPDAPAWKGDRASYRCLHDWVRSAKGPYPPACEWCGTTGYVEWANLSHEYRRDAADWAALCRKCHRGHDTETRGVAVGMFGKRLGARVA